MIVLVIVSPSVSEVPSPNMSEVPSPSVSETLENVIDVSMVCKGTACYVYTVLTYYSD